MISPLAYVDPGARIGNNVTIHPFAFIDKDTVIGDNCEIMPYVSIVHGTRIGRNNRIYQGAIIGADPQDFRWNDSPATCTIGDNNTIRENVIINRGFNTPEGTVIGSDCFIMAKSHIGHDCRIEGRTVLGNGATLAGNVRVEQCVIISSNAIIHEDSTVGCWSLIKGGCRITGTVPPYVILAHNPARYIGVNAYVMQRKGFTDGQIDDIAKAYRHIYQSGTSVSNGVRRILADLDPSEIRDTIVNNIQAANYHIVGITVELE